MYIGCASQLSSLITKLKFKNIMRVNTKRLYNAITCCIYYIENLRIYIIVIFNVYNASILITI